MKAISSVTLLELLVALVLFSVIVIGISRIDFFGSAHLISSERLAVLQNEATLVLEHMQRNIVRAIGNIPLNGMSEIIDNTVIGSDAAIRAYIDATGDGRRNTGDYWIGYRLREFSGSNEYVMRFCAQCRNKNCNQCDSAGGWQGITAQRIHHFEAAVPQAGGVFTNRVEARVRACWDPEHAMNLPNGTPDNPCVNINTTIVLPSVSTN